MRSNCSRFSTTRSNAKKRRATDAVGVFFAGLLVALLCGACHLSSEGGQHSDEASTVADIFASAEELMRLSPDPTFSVGGNGDLTLHRVRNAVFFRGGVAIAHSNEVLFLDQRGNLVWRHGREGEGPGDYKTLYGISRYNECLLVWDIGLSRFTVLDADGEYVRNVRIEPLGFTTLVGAFGDNALVQHQTMGYPGVGAEGPREVRLPIVFEAYDLRDGELTLRTSRPGEEQWAARTDDHIHGGLPIIFGRTAVAAATSQAAYIATTDSLVLTEFDGTGHERTISLPSVSAPVGRGWASFVRDSLRAAIDVRPSTGAMQRVKRFDLRLLDNLPVRPRLPPFSDVLGGRDGRLWVRSYPSPVEKNSVWVAIDREGRPQRAIEVPRNARVLDLDEDRALLLSRGPLGVELVEVYALRR